MKKIRANPNLGEGLLSNIDSHIEWLEKRHVRIASKIEVNTCSTNDLKLKGGAKQLKIKTFNPTHALNLLRSTHALNLLRSTHIFGQFMNHQKCLQSENCYICLLRSCMFKINAEKGRNSVIPVEI